MLEGEVIDVQDDFRSREIRHEIPVRRADDDGQRSE